ncbi:MAG TPA: TetR/AcrR family transcriptional regulator [Pyrinomonadaceae bacterium]|nr:TetR/AcrR family transcriptional regulator [Pyrinomonadaceae bacterium]
MARPKEFDRDQALTKAIEVFWESGFEGSSMQNLLDRMGINRASLYDTFGDKHSLYLEALGKYCEINEGILLETLQLEIPVKEKLRRFFMIVVENACSENGFRGCFINNAMIERSSFDTKTASHTTASINRIETGLQNALNNAKKSGELSSSIETAATARFLYTNLQGLQVIGKTTRDRKRLEDIIEVTLSVLK